MADVLLLLRSFVIILHFICLCWLIATFIAGMKTYLSFGSNY